MYQYVIVTYEYTILILLLKSVYEDNKKKTQHQALSTLKMFFFAEPVLFSFYSLSKK